MNTITAILEADADGTLHLPLPAELRHGKIEVTATLKAATETSSTIPRRLLSGFRGVAKGVYDNIQQADAFIRSERDQWDR